MWRRVLFSGLAVAVVAGGLMLLPGTASGDGANVINNGRCGISLGGDLYEGTNFSAVKTKKGRINASCHAVLTAGEPVAETTRVSFNGITPFGPVQCTGTLTPSGIGNFRCKG